MTNKPAVIFENVSKVYSRASGRQLLRGHVERFFRRHRHREPFYALKNVSFQLDHCESVAIIGPNGAGKSTLLSMVAGLSFPTDGKISVGGRVAALLELGTGFHPDLTGAENIHLNASLLGMTRRRTDYLFDSIIDFSGIGEFIDEPLRTYSTGMVMRLAFSVAVNVAPDILILDEVFAVGDQSFQAKCRDKVIEFKKAGKTIMCVSHAATTIHELCDRAIWLDHGELVMDGVADDVLAMYAGRSESHAAP